MFSPATLSTNDNRISSLSPSLRDRHSILQSSSLPDTVLQLYCHSLYDGRLTLSNCSAVYGDLEQQNLHWQARQMKSRSNSRNKCLVVFSLTIIYFSSTTDSCAIHLLLVSPTNVADSSLAWWSEMGVVVGENGTITFDERRRTRFRPDHYMAGPTAHRQTSERYAMKSTSSPGLLRLQTARRSTAVPCTLWPSWELGRWRNTNFSSGHTLQPECQAMRSQSTQRQSQQLIRHITKDSLSSHSLADFVTFWENANIVKAVWGFIVLLFSRTLWYFRRFTWQSWCDGCAAMTRASPRRCVSIGRLVIFTFSQTVTIRRSTKSLLCYITDSPVTDYYCRPIRRWCWRQGASKASARSVWNWTPTTTTATNAKWFTCSCTSFCFISSCILTNFSRSCNGIFLIWLTCCWKMRIQSWLSRSA